MTHIAVKDVMTTDLISVHENDIVSAAAKIFNERNFHHIPVVSDKGALSGIISLTDIDRIKTGASLFKNPNKEEYDAAIFETMWVRDLMTRSVVHLQPEDSIYNAYEIFKENHFRALPVVKENELVGMVTPIDILTYFFQKQN